MLPSLSKHFIKALLKPIIRGATPEELAPVKRDFDICIKSLSDYDIVGGVKVTKTREHGETIAGLVARRPHYHHGMNRPYKMHTIGEK